MLRRKQHFIRGCYQRSPGVVFIWIMPSISWATIGWWWLTRTRKYPCIHPTQSISPKTTMKLLEQDFAHFGYPHTLVTYSAPTFMSDEFQDYCQARGIVHLTVPHIIPLQAEPRRGWSKPSSRVSASQTKHQEVRFSSSWYNTSEHLRQVDIHLANSWPVVKFARS